MQTLYYSMATKLIMAPKWKGDFFNKKKERKKKKNMKIWSLVQKLLWNKRLACRKIQEEIFKKMFVINLFEDFAKPI